MDNKGTSLLDEIDKENMNNFEKDEKTTSKTEELKLVVEKFIGFTKKLLEKGVEISVSECNGVKWNDDIMINNGYSFYFVDKKHGQCDNKLIEHSVEYVFKPESEISIYHPEISNIIIFNTDGNNFNLYYCRDLSADISLSKYREVTFLSKPNAVNLIKDHITIAPQNINSDDIENCFRFLLNKTNNISLSKEAVIKSGACFIATSVYGSYFAPEVVILRNFRDNQLLPSPAGRAFVDKYYKISPPISNLLNKHKLLKRLILTFILKPIVCFLELQKSKSFSKQINKQGKNYGRTYHGFKMWK